MKTINKYVIETSTKFYNTYPAPFITKACSVNIVELNEHLKAIIEAVRIKVGK